MIQEQKTSRLSRFSYLSHFSPHRTSSANTSLSNQHIYNNKMEWTKKQYNQQYENYMPWIEDNVLYYFTKDNKASYATKGMADSLAACWTSMLTMSYRPAQQDQAYWQRTSRQPPRWREQPRSRPSRTRWTSTTRW